MRHEDQQSIANWGYNTFGSAPLMRKAVRAQEEMTEVLLAVARDLPPSEVVKELADVLIVMYGIATHLGYDLHAAVDAKMEVNRKRVWEKDGTGGFYHVKPEPKLKEFDPADPDDHNWSDLAP